MRLSGISATNTTFQAMEARKNLKLMDRLTSNFTNTHEGDNDKIAVEKDNKLKIVISKFRCEYIYFLVMEFRLLY